MSETLPERFAARMGHLLGPDFPTDIALAVSGGGDSMAMLALAHDWAHVFGVKLWVVTVDHGLRADSADEAAMVAKECALLGHPHETLRWQWHGEGNLQDAARRARLELIDQWRGKIAHVLMAHTQDDVAETFLMRLARGSGVEGLSAMSDMRSVRGQKAPFKVVRPLTREARADLRHHINTLKVPYVDDPSNDDPRFDRVKARQALAGLGIEAATFTATAERMQRASVALSRRAADVARDCVTQEKCDYMPTGDLLIDRDRFAEVEADTQLRILAAALQWVSSATYRPRASALEALLDRALSGGGGTLHGARVMVTPSKIRVSREYAAVDGAQTPIGTTEVAWDTRWHVCSTKPEGLTLRALGPDGWKQAVDKPGDLPPHDAAITFPAVFAGDRLIAWHPIHTSPEFQVRFAPPAGQFITFLESR
ncbi:tRNA lysidine(34) synthetase TilS [Gymnodinialimonas hymeniacidonis]|uniref:tRNA lysidine(34) synthetase TilS n=1 Tax=Gymnodinialimonas hymeniacidonis TaxID=3126508 RepID=UPI0034C66BD9